MLEAQGKSDTLDTKCPSGTPPKPTAAQYGDYFNPFGANFDAAASFGDTGANGIPSAQSTIQTEALAQVEFESTHFGYNYANCNLGQPTFSFGGTVGLTPALVLENLTSPTATIAVPSNRPMYQDAFTWKLGPKFNIVTTSESQFSVFASLGENYLISQVTSFKQGDDTITATPISNLVGQSAIFWESGVEWKYFNTDIASAYVNKTDVLTPAFSIAAGYKNDNRFNGVGALSGYATPEERIFFRFDVGLNKIVNYASATTDPAAGKYTFKFGVDYERPAGDSRMPTATRYYVSAGFDIMKVFQPSSN